MKRMPRYVVGADIVWLILALGLSYLFRYGYLPPYPPVSYRFLIMAGMGTWLLMFAGMRLDCLDGGWRLHIVIGRIAAATGLLILLLLTLAYLQKLYFSRLLLIYFTALMLVGVFLIRVASYLLLRYQHRRGKTRKAVLVGSERLTREFAHKIEQHPELLYDVIGTLYPLGMGSHRCATLETTMGCVDVLAAMRERSVDELIVLLEESPAVEFQTFIAKCAASGIHVSVLPRGYELYTSKARLIEIDGLPLISLDDPGTFPGGAVVKRVMDVVISVALILPAVFILTLATFVLMLHKRKVFRSEVRIGKDGRAFSMYRLDIDREADNAPAYERILRDLSISEVPQLWNVLRGEMSLVGPRPESQERVKHYSEWQKQRLKAKPGVTGLAQVNGLREQHASEDKTRFDLQYLLEWSPLIDILLLFQTIGTLIKRSFSTHTPSVPAHYDAENKTHFPTHTRSLSKVAHADRT